MGKDKSQSCRLGCKSTILHTFSTRSRDNLAKRSFEDCMIICLLCDKMSQFSGKLEAGLWCVLQNLVAQPI